MQVFFVYEFGGAPATSLQISFDNSGPGQSIQPGLYQLNANFNVAVQYKVDPGQNIKFVWIYDQGR